VPRVAALAALAVLVLGACDDLYPEVVVVNRIGERVLVKNASFSGCAWDQVLAYGDATAPGRCLPGEDRVHFQRLDLASYWAEQEEDAAVDGGIDDGLTDETPNWFNYQTVSVHHAEHGDFLLVELTTGDMEQDFSVPGPYGH
jgi:hypothetical protein